MVQTEMKIDYDCFSFQRGLDIYYYSSCVTSHSYSSISGKTRVVLIFLLESDILNLLDDAGVRE